MRKRIVGQRHAQAGGDRDRGWLDLEQMATVEVTSEDPSFPIESALGTNDGPGWRAAQAGEQQIRILFDQPVALHRLKLRFCEAAVARTQEFTIRWASAAGGQTREIVRQQWNFSPDGATTEVEEYAVDLQDVATLELTIRPDISGGGALATLASWRVG